MSIRTKQKELFETEVVRFALYDVGRSIDLSRVLTIVPGTPGMKLDKRRNTPGSIQLPKPLSIDLRVGPQAAILDSRIKSLTLSARVYEEGVISFMLRLKVTATLNDLLDVENFQIGSRFTTLSLFLEDQFIELSRILKPAIRSSNTISENFDYEMYTAFCFSGAIGSCNQFVEKNRKEFANLINGDASTTNLHESQIAKALANSFSYSACDWAVFGLDNCIIIDPSKDYEDLLLICELANYQLLELRTLDRMLDAWLDEAEDDVGIFYSYTKPKKMKSGILKKKIAFIQSMRLDALFILENLENSSKIIGDYFLGEIYQHLCYIFNTNEWTRSIERRITALQDVYDIVKSEKSERTMLWLEIVFIIVCIVFPLLQIIQVMMVSK
ncbi:MAG TPA: hypothetical protein P5519_11485 [Spirochaetia bacterium]|nr:hypothetical protein [Spirochaetales bacterium]HQK33359.1 hypothetical protein [Spirochaetales bacterium]HRS66495.1 hypothetical protein [Spirochaetia bacterium]HRV29809.1 hypothetical protein [Spirochaetia bacterium]